MLSKRPYLAKVKFENTGVQVCSTSRSSSTSALRSLTSSMLCCILGKTSQSPGPRHLFWSLVAASLSTPCSLPSLLWRAAASWQVGVFAGATNCGERRQGGGDSAITGVVPVVAWCGELGGCCSSARCSGREGVRGEAAGRGDAAGASLPSSILASTSSTTMIGRAVGRTTSRRLS